MSPDEKPPVRVVLADDQRLVRESLALMLNILDGLELVGTAADGEEAIAVVAEQRPDVVLMDLGMPRMDGIAATRALAERHPETRVIALTTFADDESVLGALRAGARGYLTKDASSELIQSSILSVAAGEAALDPTVQHHVVSALAAPDNAPRAHADTAGRDRAEGSPPGGSHPVAELPDELTAREAQVLALIAAGLSNAEIAERLVVTPNTVKSHINHLFAKTGLTSRSQAINYAYRTGIATPPQSH